MKSVLFAIVLVGTCLSFAAPAGGQQDSTVPLRVGGTIRPPTKVRDLSPVYPPEAQQAGVSGVVILEAIIGEDGKVRSARVLRSIPQLDQAAINAVQQWEYTPTILNGVAVPIVMTVTVNFALRGAPAAAVPSLPPPLRDTLRLLANRSLNGQVLVWDIDVVRAASVPRWNPDAEPPVSAGEAARLARNWLIGRNPEVERFVLVSVSLLRRPLPPLTSDAEFWFYQIVYSTAPTLPVQNSSMLVVVLLDGSVLEPTEVAASATQSPAP
jgi:TonB family protein